MSAKSVIITLQQIADKAVDTAAEQLTASNRKLSEETGKLSMLQNYRQEYMDKLSEKLESGGFDMQMHQNYQRFMHMLDEAITGQEQVMQRMQQQVNTDKAAWQEANKKKFSYEVLGERYTKKEMQLEQRRDQKLMDEYAMREKKIKLA